VLPKLLVPAISLLIGVVIAGLFVALFPFSTTPSSSEHVTRDEEKALSDTGNKKAIFEYTSDVSAAHRQRTIDSLEQKVQTKRATLDKLVEASASLNFAHENTSLEKQLEKLREKSETDRRIVETQESLVQEVVEANVLISLHRVDDKRIDSLVAEIRDAYAAEYAPEFNIDYVNRKLSGHVHGPARLLAIQVSDHVVKSIESEHSVSHIFETADDMKEKGIDQIIEHLASTLSNS
jgi:CRISPR/Cas system CMR subunit Cmr4 (Cas7 group RAMP superfamily)